MIPVAILFARADSIYKTLPGCDVYDIERDARTFQGGMPVVAHPPCRAWGSLKHFAKPAPGEKELAIWAVDQVRACGGVLEHPAGSQLWPTMALPSPRGMERDRWGGWTLAIWQSWWGHRADKATKLYVVGCEPADIPDFPLRLGLSTHVVSTSSSIRVGHPMYRPQLRKAEREHTPPPLAEWLVELARRCTSIRMQVAA
ncbi:MULTISPECIES: hypothetical protein [Xanthomonas]|uniref:Uncharacterized protein n=1 Tax=Xanthomonas dyei TaxID=743699 RepID=A0ABZ0D3B4_9XANT|nr:hypothetical protein [Xanthomonas dyei]WOB24765.1 hypothetical protein NYR99_13245 [Xanthomonas dyei]WOB52393.1 hypothetical protein NYR95_13250 [Xanthomonas dyei]